MCSQAEINLVQTISARDMGRPAKSPIKSKLHARIRS